MPSLRRLMAVCSLIPLAALVLTTTAAAAPSPTGLAHSSRPADCNVGAPGAFRCHARGATARGGAPKGTAAPAGYGPADLQAAYAVPASTTDVTVAIVDAYDDPNAEADLGVYRSQYGLPACTT